MGHSLQDKNLQHSHQYLGLSYPPYKNLKVLDRIRVAVDLMINFYDNGASGPSKNRTPVLEFEDRGDHGRKTKDIWEDQKAGGPKNLTA